MNSAIEWMFESCFRYIYDLITKFLSEELSHFLIQYLPI